MTIVQLRLEDYAEFLTNIQPDAINKFTAQNVIAAPNYGLLNLSDYILLLSLIFS